MLVASEGYAWSELHVVEREIRPWCLGLTRAGALEVEVPAEVGDLTSARRTLLLWGVGADEHERPEYELSVSSEPGRYRYSHIAEGTYEVRETAAEGPTGSCDAFVEQVRVERDGVASIRLPARHVWSETRCTPLAGVLSADEAKVLDEISAVVITPIQVECSHPAQSSITLRLGDELRASADGYLSWDPVPVLPGTYRVDLKPLGFTFTESVPASPLHTLDRALPAPLTVTVEVRGPSCDAAVPFTWLAATTVPRADRSSIFRAPLRVLREVARPAVLELLPGSTRFTVAVSDGATQHFVRDLTESGVVELCLEPIRTVRFQSSRLGRPWPLREADWTSLRLFDTSGTRLRVGSISFGNSMSPGWCSDIEYRLPLSGRVGYEIAGIRGEVDLGQEAPLSPVQVLDFTGVD